MFKTVEEASQTTETEMTFLPCLTTYGIANYKVDDLGCWDFPQSFAMHMSFTGEDAIA